VNDLTPHQNEDIKSGKFERILNTYEEDRQRFLRGMRPIKFLPFRDYGEYDVDMPFCEKIHLYERLHIHWNLDS